MAKILAQGKGKLHGIDSSQAMIDASVKALKDIGVENSTFEGRCFPLKYDMQPLILLPCTSIFGRAGR